MIVLKKILLVEDNPNDVELTIEALSEHNLANRVVVLTTEWKLWIICIIRGNISNGKKRNPR